MTGKGISVNSRQGTLRSPPSINNLRNFKKSDSKNRQAWEKELFA